jgi:ABC-type branched-subunit amino acid transport system ATPase component
VALALGSRAYVLDQGRVEFAGGVAELRASRDIQQRYLGVT